MESPRNEDALTAPEVASILQINRNTVYALAKEGALNSYRVGRKLRFTMKDVQSYIDSAKHNAPAPAAAPVEAAAPGAKGTEGARFAIGGHDMMLDITANYLAAMNQLPSACRPLPRPFPGGGHPPVGRRDQHLQPPLRATAAPRNPVRGL